MNDKDSSTPRVFLARHGQTEWTKSGRYTGTTELDLTPEGRQQVLATAQVLVGSGKLIDPTKLACVFVSPRKRAQTTFDLLFRDRHDRCILEDIKITTTGELSEWDYGAYEGLVTREIHSRRQEQGLDLHGPWNIWKDGCEDGESADAVATRLDSLIDQIRRIQAPNMNGEMACDVVIVSHGHLLRAFVKRWLQYPMDMRLPLMLEPGGIGVLSYQHHNVDEPSLMVGMAFPSAGAAS